MALELKPLPFAEDALEPHISKRTIYYHYQKHHAGYVKKTNDALEGSDLAGKPLEEIITAAGEGKLYNTAAQIWNHDFYWQSLTPETCEPSARLTSMIEATFGDAARFENAFSEAAAEEFGSGWAWLGYDPARDALLVTSTNDAVNPLTRDWIALLTLDVWEHAYYLDVQHERPRYIEAVLGNLMNWEFASDRLEQAIGRR